MNTVYQADWLLRVYGFTINEVTLALDKDNLSLRKNPKLAIALKRPWQFPVDINTASYSNLLRVPGIGPISAKRIVTARQDHKLYSLEQLKKMRVVVKQAGAFVWFKGMAEHEKQSSFLPLLDEEDSLSQEPSLLAITA